MISQILVHVNNRMVTVRLEFPEENQTQSVEVALRLFKVIFL